MALEFLQILDKRAGVASLTNDVVRQRARTDRGRSRVDPSLVNTPVFAGIPSPDAERLSPVVNGLIVPSSDRGTGISVFSDMPGFTKQVEIAIAGRDAATGNFYEKLPQQGLVRFRPEDSDAFIKNAALGAAATIRTGSLNDTLFSDLNRAVGIFEKEQVQATITIQTYVQGQVPLVVTNQFILASVSESSQEKYQIFQTFDEDLIYFFDRNPHIYTYGGVLYNAADISEQLSFNWKNRFQSMYEKKLRGTKCVDNNARAILTYEDVTREGYLLNFQMSEDSNNPTNIPFSFVFFVTKETNNVQDASLFPVTTPVDFTGINAARDRLRLQKENIQRAREIGLTASGLP